MCKNCTPQRGDQLSPAHSARRMTDLAALAAEMTARATAAVGIDWATIYKSAKIALAEATANGGVVTYQVNGRSVTRSVAEIREILTLAKDEMNNEAGGIVTQLGEFGT